MVKVHANKQFEKTETDLLPVILRICGVDEHIPVIEQSVQTYKNENHAVCYAMPYKCIPHIMRREVVNQGNQFPNDFGTKSSISDRFSIRNIINNITHADYNNLK